MGQVLKFKKGNKVKLPENFENVRFPEELVEFVLNEYTNEGDYVLDPFLGFGTTILVAERMNRSGYGVEINKDRVEFVRSLVKNTNSVICDDIFNIDKYNLLDFDLCLTSPYFMEKGDKNPFNTKLTEQTEYEQYLVDMVKVFSKIKTK